jgi:type I restriction enzyme S subunit
MFPQVGETTPRVRFKGFEGEWIKIKFAAFAEINRGLTYTPNNIVENGVRVLRSSNIDEDVFTISNEDVFVTPNCVNICYAKDGDILVTAANGSPRLVGKHAIIRNTGSIPVVAGGFMYLVTSQESEFLNASMSSNWYWSFIKIGVAGGNGSIGNLNRNDLEETVFPIPSLKEERDMIASYFTSLDSQITLQTQHLEKLKQIKSACLDNMFV